MLVQRPTYYTFIPNVASSLVLAVPLSHAYLSPNFNAVSNFVFQCSSSLSYNRDARCPATAAAHTLSASLSFIIVLDANGSMLNNN